MIKFVTILNADLANTVNKHALKKAWWAFALLSLLSIAVGAAFIATGDLILGVFFIVFGAVFGIIMLVATVKGFKKPDNVITVMSDQTVQTFVFDREQINVVSQKGDEYRAELTARYSYFSKVEETATHYFLYISKQQMHVFAKADLTEGSLEELNAILTEKLGANFKRKKK